VRARSQASVAVSGGDAYGLTLKYLTSAVLAAGAVMVGCHKCVAPPTGLPWPTVTTVTTVTACHRSWPS